MLTISSFSNIFLQPGDMVLYESHSVLHGRPFPLKGRYYSNIFIHFEPVGHSLRHGADGPDGDITSQYRRAVESGTGGGHEHDTSIPPYVVEGTEEAERYHRMPSQWMEAEWRRWRLRYWEYAGTSRSHDG